MLSNPRTVDERAWRRGCDLVVPGPPETMQGLKQAECCIFVTVSPDALWCLWERQACVCDFTGNYLMHYMLNVYQYVLFVQPSAEFHAWLCVRIHIRATTPTPFKHPAKSRPAYMVGSYVGIFRIVHEYHCSCTRGHPQRYLADSQEIFPLDIRTSGLDQTNMACRG